MYRQLFPGDKNRETLINKVLKKKSGKKFKKRRTNREIQESLKRIQQGYNHFLQAQPYPHFAKVGLRIGVLI